MKILIVDDEGKKQQRVGYLIKNSPMLENSKIDTRLTISEARELLKSTFYDFLILDLNIAEDLGDEPSINAGSEFIDEIIEIDAIKKPSNIIILSSNEDSKDHFKNETNKKGFELLSFDITKTDWEEKLLSKLEYHAQCIEQRVPTEEKYDVCIVAAVDVEMEQLKRLWGDWKLVDYQRDSTRYFSTNFVDKNGDARKILIAQQSEMGMASSTFLSTKLIIQFEPKYLIMVGIAASTKDEYGFGDIIIPDTIWNYSSGKFIKENDSEAKLLPDAKSLLLNPRIRDIIYQTDFGNELYNIKREFSGNHPDSELKIAKGPMACGAAVISDFSIVKDWVLSHSRKNVGLDMESYGIFFAANNSFVSNTLPLCIKSISDFADTKKGDAYQRYAAYTSSSFAKLLIEKYLPF